LCQRFADRFTYHARKSSSGTNPTMITSYSASVVKIYSTASSLMRFENNTIFNYFEERSSLLQLWLCSCKL
jgi:hypothetical protein